MKKMTIGLLAHVDAGKTTLSESLLYQSGNLRNFGRVDHQNSFLDYDALERKRGITIFSKQAIFEWQDVRFTLLDTPGHVDFSSEMERVLQVLDMAILVGSGVGGVQAHTLTIWKLLHHYQIPVFIFVNKMDIAYRSKEEIMTELHQKLSDHCIDFTLEESLRDEQIAMCQDELLEAYMNEQLTLTMVQKAIEERKVIPCFFGSALKQFHVKEFLNLLASVSFDKSYPEQFGAKVFKITHTDGVRLTHVKIMGGKLAVKSVLQNEKIDEIRFYSGLKYKMSDCAEAGDICALKGLTHVLAGEGLGFCADEKTPVLQPYMNYRMILPEGCDVLKMLDHCSKLADEDPQLHVSYDSSSQQIHLQLMGEIQIEVLKNIFLDRFHEKVDFDTGVIHYMETIEDCVEGVGHFEPLRHYAEVHLRLEPLPRGSGLVFESECSEDELARNWQRLILTHLFEKEHKGVLIGAPITDMKITLIAGRAHLKHTEGGDFREATYRAVRHGLKKAHSVLLEPIFEYRMEIPVSYMSKAIFDIENMNGTYEAPMIEDDLCIIHGTAPVKGMQNYQQSLIHATKGVGRVMCTFKEYAPVKNQDTIIEQFHYNSEADLDNPTGSVFCAQGAGFYVPWQEVENYMHIKRMIKEEPIETINRPQRIKNEIDEKELQRIFERSMPQKKRTVTRKKKETEEKVEIRNTIKPQCLLVDGYNMIYSWPILEELAKEDLNAARDKLIDMMCDYQGYRNCLLILVFDAYKVAENTGKVNYNGAIHVVFTKTAQTADAYIEKATHELANKYNITVATSDGLEQLIVTGQGARRMSARELWIDLNYLKDSSKQEMTRWQSKIGNRLLEDLREMDIEEEKE